MTRKLSEEHKIKISLSRKSKFAKLDRPAISGQRCGVCKNLIKFGDHYSKITKSWTCKMCADSLINHIDSVKLEDIIHEVDFDDTIFDKERCKRWIVKVFDKEKEDYVEYGYGNETYGQFLRITYTSTDQSFPNTVKEELNEN